MKAVSKVNEYMENVRFVYDHNYEFIDRDKDARRYSGFKDTGTFNIHKQKFNLTGKLDINTVRRTTYAFWIGNSTNNIYIGSAKQVNEDKFVKKTGRNKAYGRMMQNITNGKYLSEEELASLPAKVKNTINYELRRRNLKEI